MVPHICLQFLNHLLVFCYVCTFMLICMFLSGIFRRSIINRLSLLLSGELVAFIKVFTFKTHKYFHRGLDVFNQYLVFQFPQFLFFLCQCILIAVFNLYNLRLYYDSTSSSVLILTFKYKSMRSSCIESELLQFIFLLI